MPAPQQQTTNQKDAAHGQDGVNAADRLPDTGSFCELATAAIQQRQRMCCIIASLQQLLDHMETRASRNGTHVPE